mgnify:CR=1 FL=1
MKMNDYSLKIEKFKNGIFDLRTRRFGTVAEIMIKKLYGLNESGTLAFDKRDTVTNARVEIKFSTALKKNEEAINKACPDIHVSINYEDGVQQVLLNGENVNGLIRTEEVGNMASKTSAYKTVRATLLDLQRDLAKTANILMDGRDIGTNVLPDADLKIYLTASSKVRAERRYKELVEKGVKADFNKIEEDIIIRDRQDMEREIAPLKQADDAVLVDSSDMTIEEVVDAIVAEFEKVK